MRIVHIDIDAFLASAEQLREPALIGRAVVVGGEKGERGLVLSSSYEARRRGILPGLTIAQAERLLPSAVFRRGDARSSGELAERVWEICRRFTPQVEVTSIDDCYLDVTGTERLFGPAHEVARRIRRAVREEVGFRLTMGVGASRTVARVATCFGKPGGVVEVPRGEEAKFLAPLPIRRLPGIGRKTEEALHRYNVKTIGELQRIPVELLVATFGEGIGRLLGDRARGVDDRPVRPDRGPRSVSRETSFDPETADREVIRGMLYYLLERAARAVREDGLMARTVGVRIRYADGPGDHRSRSFPEPVDREREMWHAAKSLFDALYTRRVRLKLVGVTLSGLTRDGTRQAGLFSEDDRQRERRLTGEIDRIRRRFGFASITAGAAIDLLPKFPQNGDGFVLKTPSLTK